MLRYHYEPGLGDPNDAYTRVDMRHTPGHQPELPATFVATVEGEAFISTMWGRRVERWRAEPGTPCVILGYWSDGTVHLKWPAIRGNYTVDGRFPAWVVTEDPEAVMAGGGRVLQAHQPPPPGRSFPLGLVLALVVVIFIVLVALLLHLA